MKSRKLKAGEIMLFTEVEQIAREAGVSSIELSGDAILIFAEAVRHAALEEAAHICENDGECTTAEKIYELIGMGDGYEQ